jgi:hypothetical protein
MQQSRGTNASGGMAASYLADKIKLSLKNFSSTWREYSVKLISQSLSRAIVCKNDQLTTLWKLQVGTETVKFFIEISSFMLRIRQECNNKTYSVMTMF